MYTGMNHTRRVRDISILWFSADFTHGIYIRDASTLNINGETFRKYSKLCGNNKIKSCKTDVCDTCTVFREQLNVQDLFESATLELTIEFQLHLRRAKLARLDYNNDHSRQGYTHISFDFSQNLILPQLHDQPSDMYFLSLLNSNLFGIYNETQCRQMNKFIEKIKVKKKVIM
eukprot:NODE_374_length_8570_cov_0.578208.p1 type:complete len:173 gc:universal NODE_374_length_8570_cov_0.578208:6233-6751(+)